MNIHGIIPGAGAIFFGILLSLIAYNIIGKNFTSPAYHDWLNNRRTFYKFLGPILIIAGISLIIFRV